MAVAGSGKTQTLVHRILWLLQERKVPAKEILVLMFNRSAAQDFRERLTQWAPKGLELPSILTFHALAHRLLPAFARRGWCENFRLLHQARTRHQIALEAKGLFAEEAKEPDDLLEALEIIKSRGLGFREGLEWLFQKREQELPSWMEAALETFEEERLKLRIRFFEDLLVDCLKVLQKEEKARQWCSNKKSHILVDEVQDISPIQADLVRVLAGEKARIMVVGDPDQCIYEWRGAEPSWLTQEFPRLFPDFTDLRLTLSFRYGTSIAIAASRILDPEKLLPESSVLAHPQNPPTRIQGLGIRDSASECAEQLKNWFKAGYKPEDAAILVRLKEEVPMLEMALLEHEIPSVADSDLSLFHHPVCQGLAIWLKLVYETEPELDAEHWETWLKWPRPCLDSSGVRALLRSSQPLKTRLNRLEEQLPATNLYMAREATERIGLLKELRSSRPAPTHLISRLERALGLHQANHQDLIAEWIAWAWRSHLPGEDMARSLLKPHKSGVEVMTLHRAKGLQWPLVVLPGLEDGNLPYLSNGNQTDLASERRLFYVGMTRASRELLLLHPPDTSLSQNQTFLPQAGSQASRFLYDLNLHHLGDVCQEIKTRKPVQKEALRYLSSLEKVLGDQESRTS